MKLLPIYRLALLCFRAMACVFVLNLVSLEESLCTVLQRHVFVAKLLQVSPAQFTILVLV